MKKGSAAAREAKADRRERKKPSRLEKLQHLDRALSYVKAFRLAVDVGAHWGLWTTVMAGRFARVEAFEPLQANIDRWHARLKDFPNATLHRAAVGDEARKVRLKDGESHSKHWAIKESGDIDMVRLDDFGFTDLDFLKVDTEGADALVLKGAEQTLRRCRPVVIVESVPRFEERYGLPPGAPMLFLESLGAVRVAEIWRDFIYVFPDAR